MNAFKHREKIAVILKHYDGIEIWSNTQKNICSRLDCKSMYRNAAIQELQHQKQLNLQYLYI